MKIARVALWAGFFFHGALTVVLGPLIPELRETWDLSRAELSLLFPAQFVASAVGAVASTLRLRLSLVGGYSLLAAGLLLVAWTPWPGPLGAMALVGLGLGLLAAATNLEVARSAPPGESRGGRLSLLNMFWGLGAVTCPLLFALAAGRLGVPWLLTLLAALVTVPALALTRLEVHAEPSAGFDFGRESVRRALGDAVRLLPVAGLLFFYVGIEATLGGWLVAHAESVAPEQVALWITSGFWAALLLGRALVPRILRRLGGEGNGHAGEPRLYVLALGGSFAGLLVLRHATDVTPTVAGALLAGFALAPVFPLTVSFLAEQTAERGEKQAGWVFAFCGLGGATLPWAVGRLPGAGGSLAEGFVVPLAGLACMAVLFAVQRRLVRPGC